MKTKIQVFAIVRIFGVVETREDAVNEVSVVKVLDCQDDAIKEAERLNKLNGSKGAYYFSQATRYYPANSNSN